MPPLPALSETKGLNAYTKAHSHHPSAGGEIEKAVPRLQRALDQVFFLMLNQRPKTSVHQALRRARSSADPSQSSRIQRGATAKETWKTGYTPVTQLEGIQKS